MVFASDVDSQHGMRLQVASPDSFNATAVFASLRAFMSCGELTICVQYRLAALFNSHYF